MNKKYKPLIILLLAVAGMPGCKKFTEVPPPKNEVIPAEVFKSDVAAVAPVAGIYQHMMVSTSFENSGITRFGGMSADELVRTSDNVTEEDFANNVLTSDNYMVTDMWRQSYGTLAQANACIQGLSASQTLSDPVKNQLLGESYFSRAFELFLLTNLWGDVPIVTTTDWKTNAIVKRSPAADVYKQIIEDLTKAKSLLVEKYTTADKVRPNIHTASALLAKVYLYMKDWKNAEAEASLVLNSGLYTPLPTLSNAFVKSNKEAIWQLVPDYGWAFGHNTDEAYTFIGYSSYGYATTYILTGALLNAFEPNDPRKTAWVGKVTQAGTDYYYPYKYKVGDFATALSEYYTVFRASEQYLIRAEAYAQQNKIPEAVADLNIIRKRARGTTSSLPDIAASISQQDCLLAVEQERRIELFCEWGNRWLDLKRTGRAETVLKPVKPNWKATAQLFPVPATERQKDPGLSQNPGYDN